MRFSRWSLLLTIAALGGAVRAADPLELDWDAWERLPVLENGRRMPLDSFARSTVQAICGRQRPTLWLPMGSGAAERGVPHLSLAKEMFAEGQPRKFRPAELFFSWLVEPERWQSVPFLAADHKGLRADVLDVPRNDNEGRRLRFASPWTVENCSRLHRQFDAIQTREREEKGWEPTGVDLAVDALGEAFLRFRALADDPARELRPPSRFMERLGAARESLGKLAQILQREGQLQADDPASKLALAAAEPLDELLSAAHRKRFAWKEAEAQTAALVAACEALVRHFGAKRGAPAALLAVETQRHAQQAHLALYDPAITLRLVPALDAAALEVKRDAADDASPWLGVRAMLNGSPALMRDYPQAELKRARAAFERAKKVYLDRGNSERREQFSAAMDEFAAAVGQLGEAITPLRERLPVFRQDEELLAMTAYPPPEFTSVEVAYNRLDPFFWSWVVSLAATLCFSLAFGILRRPMFWLGIAVLVAAQAAMLGGFSLRYRVTGLVPLTNMFESVAFVAMSVALLGIWFALLPLFWPGLRLAWRLTALPLPWRTAAPSPEDAALLRPERWRPVQAALGVARLVLVGLTFCWLARLSPDSAFGYFDIALRLDSAATWSQNLNDAVVWAVGWCVLLLALYYLPRAALAAAVALCCTVPWTLAQRGLAEPMRQVGQRKVFALVGAVVCFLAAATAYYAPNRVINKEISTAAAVLRSNFWLFVHVLTICASYAAGALAWGLSNISLGYCLMGRYRPASGGGRPEPDYLPAGDEEPDEAAAAPPARLLPPEPCAALAQYTYKATQVAVVLLAAGTILGALWADKAWGRFWSWDAKEVWSLLTLFAYMAILHARHIGWVGNFGLAVGSVLGATFIVFAWYGVNFLLPQGLHSYGKSSGGQVQVAIVIVLNWLFAVAAGVRYQVMMNLPMAAEPTPTPPSRPRRAPQSGRGRG